MKRLVINADDLGADEARNEGIFEAIKAGVVTSVSILPNGPALEHALSGIRSLGRIRISIGIHANLSEGKPVSMGLKLLTGHDGYFRGKRSARQLLAYRGDLKLEEEIRVELAAQIAILQGAGVPVDHLDGHQHVHVFSAVIAPVADGIRSHGIPWIRIPEEPFAPPRSEFIEEAEFFSSHAAAARPYFQASGLLTTDQFRGLYLKGRLPAAHWIEFLEAIPHGLTEFMVHPGRVSVDTIAGPFSAFSTMDREMELEALIDGRFLTAILKAGIELIPFPEATN
jgi:chitin disaccharide deacetylase